MATPPLGFITPAQRTQAQHDAHADAVNRMVKFAFPPVTLAAGQKVCLFDAWKHPDVVAEVGFEFSRFHQFTGSCVGVGGGNALYSTICMQRVAGSQPPTQAFLPFWPGPYAMSRHYMGDDGKGDGSLGSTFAKALTADGIRDWAKNANLPEYTNGDGITVANDDVEYTWSSYRNPALQAVLTESRQHLLGSAAECRSANDIKAMIVNGYGVSFACNNYIGKASVQGSGTDACVVGYWDGSGGHQQSIHAVWEHPTLGTLYWAQNSWPGSTYPKDPAGGPICGCWVTEANVEKAMRLDGEVFGFSHLSWFPANPKVLHWLI